MRILIVEAAHGGGTASPGTHDTLPWRGDAHTYARPSYGLRRGRCQCPGPRTGKQPVSRPDECWSMTDMQNSPPAALPSAPWAEVRVAERVIRYRRAGRGRGRVILLLMASSAAEADEHWPEMSDTLAQWFRVLQPEPPATTSSVAAVDPDWLDALLDGLGIPDVALLAGEPFHDAALSLLTREDIAAAILVTTAAPPIDSPRPLLLLDPALTAEAACQRIREFLERVP